MIPSPLPARRRRPLEFWPKSTKKPPLVESRYFHLAYNRHSSDEDQVVSIYRTHSPKSLYTPLAEKEKEEWQVIGKTKAKL